jgi:4-oxalocrotonate tautomerase
MPHVIVKLWPGRNEQQKRVIADRVIQAVAESAGVPATAVTVGIEEVAKERWHAEVHVPDVDRLGASIYRST